MQVYGLLLVALIVALVLAMVSIENTIRR